MACKVLGTCPPRVMSQQQPSNSLPSGTSAKLAWSCLLCSGTASLSLAYLSQTPEMILGAVWRCSGVSGDECHLPWAEPIPGGVTGSKWGQMFSSLYKLK